MSQFYIDQTANIRITCYVLLTICSMYWSAVLAVHGNRHRALLLLLTGAYWIGSLHYALNRDARIPLYFTTPVVVALTVAWIIYIVRGFDE